MDGSEQHQSGVVDQDVEASEALDNRLDGGLGLGSVGDVGRYGEGGAAGLPNIGDEVGEAVLAPGDQGDRGPVAGQLDRGGVPDAAAGPGDHLVLTGNR